MWDDITWLRIHFGQVDEFTNLLFLHLSNRNNVSTDFIHSKQQIVAVMITIIIVIAVILNKQNKILSNSGYFGRSPESLWRTLNFKPGVSQPGPFLVIFLLCRCFCPERYCFWGIRKEEDGGGEKRKRKLATALPDQANFLLKTLLFLMMCQHNGMFGYFL